MMTDFKIVDKEIADEATKSGKKRKKINDLATIALRQLEIGKAIQVPLPEMVYSRITHGERDRIRGYWGYRTRKITKEGKMSFKIVTSDDSNSLFIQRIVHPKKSQ